MNNSPFPASSPIIVYLRHSPGEDQTLTSQESAVRAWCAEHQLVIVRAYKDEAKSGTSTAGRDGFLAMVDALRDNLITPRPVGVIVWSFSRFAREYDDAAFYTALIRRAGYRIHSLTEQISDDNVGRVVESLYHFQAAEQSRKISADAKRGLRWLAQQGYSVGGFPPRGYRKSAGIEVGRKRNGEPRIAHKWEFDEAWEARVRRAWAMKCDGALNWQIHNELQVYDAINSYTTFFSNYTYAGFRKCADLLIPNAHPAYVELGDFERVQHLRRAVPHNRKSANGDPQHSKRHQSPFLLSGLLFCACGYAMSGQTYGGIQYYKCGRKHRWGSTACDSHAIVAWYINELVTDWLCDNVLTLDQLRADRVAINVRLDGDRTVLESRRNQITRDLAALDKRVKNLLDAIELSGLTPEMKDRLGNRQTEARELQAEQARLDARLNQPHIEMSDAALEYIAAHLRDELRGESFEETRALLRQVVVRVELGKNEMTISHVSPLAETPKTVITDVPPRGYFLIDELRRATFTFANAPTGAASERYHRRA